MIVPFDFSEPEYAGMAGITCVAARCDYTTIQAGVTVCTLTKHGKHETDWKLNKMASEYLDSVAKQKPRT